MNDLVRGIEVFETFKHSKRDHADNVDGYGAELLVDVVKGTVFAELHADAKIGRLDVGAVYGDDVWGATCVQDLEFAQDLLSNRRLCIDQHDLRAYMSANTYEESGHAPSLP